MAIRFSLHSNPITTLDIASSRSPRTNSRQVKMCANSHNLQIRSFHSHRQKVFEDESAGIVCYKDENGEITCEGYDEGPRCPHQISRFSLNSSIDVEIVQLLQRCWVQVAEDQNAGTGVAGQNCM